MTLVNREVDGKTETHRWKCRKAAVPQNTLRQVVFVVLLAAPCLATADVVSEIRDTARAIIQADEAYRTDAAHAPNLDSQLEALTRHIESGALNPSGLAIARYWRGRGYLTVNGARMKAGQKTDLRLARASLADFDSVIANGADIPAWGISLPDALYFAGGVARNHLEDFKLAYAYWQKCASAGHAGCLNIMASAKLTGSGGIQANIPESIELNRQVYDGGTEYRCAGAYSARMIAETIHFSGERSVVVDDLEWIRRAYLLLDEISVAENSDNPCDRAKFEIIEYLIRLARGEEKPELLRAAAARKAENDYRILAQYLAGSVSPQAFRDALTKVPLKHVACGMNYAAAWHARLRNDTALSETYIGALAAFGGDHCQIELTFLRLKKAR